MKYDTFAYYCSRTKRNLILSPSEEICGVTGDKLTIYGQTQLKIDGVGVITVVVTDNKLKHELILGDDFLRKYKVVINYEDKTIKIKNKQFKLLKGKIDKSEIFTAESQKHPECIQKVLDKNKDIFSERFLVKNDSPLKPMRIETDSRPIKSRPYRTPIHKLSTLNEMIDNLLEDNIIRPSSSPWSSPCSIVPKPDGSPRFVVDYRKVNKVIKDNAYNLPLIQEIFDKIGGNGCFTTMDLKSGFYQFPIREEDKEITAFACHRGLFEFNVTPMGLKTSPGHFQSIMNDIFKDLLDVCICVYMDDIVIYSKNINTHAKHLQMVFDRLRKAGLKLHPRKGEFAKSQIKLLGYIVNKDGIMTDPAKTEAIRNMAPPKSVKELRSFLGATGYYKQCIPNYAHIAGPLTELLKKDHKFLFEKRHTDAFNKIKQMMISTHVMAHPRTDKPFKVYTDACDYCVGAILVQDDENGCEKVVQYVSHKLHGAELKWATMEKEGYAVIYALQKLRHYLYGAKFKIYTDHRPLLGMFRGDTIKNQRVQRWALLLSEFQATIEYKPGKLNERADLLSRIHHLKSEQEVAIFDTEDWIDPEAFPDCRSDERLPLEADMIDKDLLIEAQKLEFDKYIKEADLTKSEFQVIDDLLYSVKPPTKLSALYPRLMLPSKFRETVLRRTHGEVGHMGCEKTLSRIHEAYVWPGMRKDTKQFINQCPVCAIHKRKPVRNVMGEMPIANYPMQIVSMDLIGPLTPSEKSNAKYVLNIIDHCTGWAECYPMISHSAKEVWDALANDFFPRHGFPEIIIADNAQEFQAIELRNYMREVCIDYRHSTPYHPQSNGKIERFNKTLKAMLAKMVNNVSKNWEYELATALTAYRISVSNTTGFTPFFLLYGRRSRQPLTKLLSAKDGDYRIGSRLKTMSDNLKIAKEMTINSRRYNRDRLAAQANAQELKVGDTVMLKAEPDRLPLTGRWDPQFEVLRVMGLVCEIRNQATGRTKIVNRERVYLVDPNIAWEGIEPRPKRKKNNRVQKDTVPPVYVRDNREIAQPANETLVPILEEEEAYRQSQMQPNPTTADSIPLKRNTRLNKRRLREKRKRHYDLRASSDDEYVMPQKRYNKTVEEHTSQSVKRKREAQTSSDETGDRERRPRAAKRRALDKLRDYSNNEQQDFNSTTRETRNRKQDHESPQRERSRSREGRRESSESDGVRTRRHRTRSLDR